MQGQSPRATHVILIERAELATRSRLRARVGKSHLCGCVRQMLVIRKRPLGNEARISVRSGLVFIRDIHQVPDIAGEIPGRGSADWDRANTPATGLCYVDVQEYVAWISASTDHSFRLPSVGEWTFMAASVLPEEPDPLFTDPSLKGPELIAMPGLLHWRRTSCSHVLPYP